MLSKEEQVLKRAFWLYKEHYRADLALFKKELDCNLYEYSRIPYKSGKRYIGLRSRMDDVLNNPIWQEAYQLLTRNNVLELDTEWDNPTHYRVVFDTHQYE